MNECSIYSVVVLGGCALQKGTTTYTWLEVQLIILAIELVVNPVAVAAVAAEEAVTPSPTVVLVPVVAAAAVVVTKSARELADLVATVCNRSDHSSLLQLLFGTRWLLVAT